MTPKYDADVVIIGYGPVGATLANLLGLSGISTLVLEREEAAYHLPRAVHFDDEAMRVFQTIGLAEEIEQTVHVSPGMRFMDANGRILLEWPRPNDRTAQGWHASYRFHQPDLERILRDGLARFPLTSVRAHREALAVDQDANGVIIRCENLCSSMLERVRVHDVATDGRAGLTTTAWLGSQLRLRFLEQKVGGNGATTASLDLYPRPDRRACRCRSDRLQSTC
jgi:3-(3-hydroxy-phenyl)propionate hydroxylase